MQAITIAAHMPESVRAFVFTKSAFVSGIISGVTSFATTEFTTGNTVLAFVFSAVFSAGSAALVAYFRSRPSYIAALSNAKISESELLGKQTAELIRTLKKTADDNSRIATVQVFARHKVQGFYQASVSHIDYLHLIMAEHGMKIPSFEKGDVDLVLKELDDKVNAIKDV